MPLRRSWVGNGHAPVRPPNTLGMVVERRRPPGETEHVIFYCENCEALVEDIHFDCGDIVQHFSQAMLDFWNDDARRTCKNCGEKVEQPGPTITLFRLTPAVARSP